jgi:NlpE N-terminal domain
MWGLVLLVGSAAACGGDPLGEPPPDRTPPPGSQQLGVFEGKVPCAECERTKVRLTLHHDAVSGAPTAYVLERIDVGHGNDRQIFRGTWATTVGSAADPNSTIVTLSNEPAELTHFQQVGQTLLLVLDDTLEPRVGNSVHSFTLSKTE